MFQRESVPFAPALVASMRSLGYEFHAAIADLIDNSISAGAKKIDIYLVPSEDPTLVILDNGRGMSNDELEHAMRYGSSNPDDIRSSTDLGRYGLGMKSASLSQCRKLTVVSKKNEQLSGYSWDIDNIIKTQSWSLIGYENFELEKIESIDLLKNYPNGTMLILNNFDRIVMKTKNLADTLTHYISETTNHLALVFHRYIEEGIVIKINGRSIEPRDPFLIENKNTQPLREQSFEIDNNKIIVKPYILPHFSKLNEKDIQLVGGKESFRNDQGFYIYRNRRLIIWGTWFRLENKDELNKLGRVRVDIPNTLDYIWSIDIKKSTAHIPEKIRKNLISCISETVSTSKTVHKFRGRKENNGIIHVWEKENNENRDGFHYRINRNIPELQILKESLSKSEYKKIDQLLVIIEDTFPSASLYVDYAEGKVKERKISNDTVESFNEIMEQIRSINNSGLDIKSLFKAFQMDERYFKDKDLVQMIDEEIKKYE